MQAIYDFDFAVLDALQKIHNTFLDRFFAVFTYIGEGGAMWILLAVGFMIFKSTRRLGISCTAGLVSDLLINELLIKNTVKRPRPFTLHPYIDTIVHRPSSYSFPSGHSCVAFTCATVIFCYNRKLGIAAYATAALIAFSRNYFYIHFPTDVIAGMLDGILLGILSTLLMKKVFALFDSRIKTEGAA